MSLVDSIFGSQTSDLQNALTRTTQREALLMNNLANVNVPGYKREDMDFHVALTGAMDSPQTRLQRLQADAGAVQSSNSSIRTDGNNVDLEKEVTAITEMQLRYQALTQITVNVFTNLNAAIKAP